MSVSHNIFNTSSISCVVDILVGVKILFTYSSSIKHIQTATLCIRLMLVKLSITLLS